MAWLGRFLLRWTFVAAVLLAFATVCGFAGRWAWILDLSSHFRLQYFYGGLIVLGIFAVSRRLRGALLGLGIVAVNGALIIPLYTGGSAVEREGPAGRPVLRLLIANVHATSDAYGRFVDLVRAEQPDLLLLSEIDGDWLRALEMLVDEFPQAYRVVRARQDNFGIALLSRRSLDLGEIRILGPAALPSIEARFQHGGQPVHVVLTHPLPPSRPELAALRDAQLEEVGEFVRNLGPRTILAGDLNTTPWACSFSDLLKSSGLRDSTTGFGPQVSWPTTLPGPLRIPIDHCLHSSDLEVVDRRIGPDIGSDHLPLIVDLR